jgi:iron complex transport system ATP-binding protein
MSIAIDVDRLTFGYREEPILKALSLAFEEGGFHAIVGPNGSGKTTLLKNLLRHLTPSKGRVRIGGDDLSALRQKELARRIASVPQQAEGQHDFTCSEIVLMGRTPYLGRFARSGPQEEAIVREAMEKTHTWHLRDARLNDVSGGERQRVIIARAIAQRAKIMLLDEPISNLDIHHQVQVLDTVKSLCLSEGITVICVLHDLNLAAQYADRMVLLSRGQVVSEGTPQEVMEADTLADVYGSHFQIIDHPLTGTPLILPMSQIS